MPLPYLKNQCKAFTKRKKQRCKNPTAYGCKTCRMHGARKKNTIKRGEQHPNYVHGGRTLEAEKQSSQQSLRLNYLEDAMHVLGMTTAKHARGRKANGYRKLTRIDDIKKAIG